MPGHSQQGACAPADPSAPRRERRVWGVRVGASAIRPRPPVCMDEVAVALTLRLQQVQARLGVVPPPRTAEESFCLVCMANPSRTPCCPACTCARARRARSI